MENEMNEYEMNENIETLENGKQPVVSRKKHIIKEIVSWIEIAVFAVAISLIINHFIIINATVPSGSMENTIMTGDRMIGLRVSYWFSSPDRGDVVIFNNPEYVEGETPKDSKLYVKRTIGLPGETVKIVDGKVYINDSEKPLKESYLKEEWIKNAGYDTGIDYNSGALNFYVPKKGDKIVITDGVKYLNGKQIVLKDSYLEGVSEGTKSVPDGEYKVSEDCYFLMGDNRNDSWDCRYWSGTNYVSEDDILARAVTGYLPWRGFYARPDYE